MKLPFSALLLLFSFSALAQTIACKSDYNLASYRKNIWGNLVRTTHHKMLHDMSVETFTVSLPVNEDGSAFFSSSSHLSGNQRLDTYYKTIRDSHEKIRVTALFTSQGQELAGKEIILSDHRHSETVILDELFLLEKDGKTRTMIESISFNCEMVQK